MVNDEHTSVVFFTDSQNLGERKAKREPFLLKFNTQLFIAYDFGKIGEFLYLTDSNSSYMSATGFFIGHKKIQEELVSYNKQSSRPIKTVS